MPVGDNLWYSRIVYALLVAMVYGRVDAAALARIRTKRKIKSPNEIPLGDETIIRTEVRCCRATPCLSFLHK